MKSPQKPNISKLKMKKSPIKRKKKSPYKKLKDKLWDMFSKYIRLKYADKDGYVTCVTCGRIMFWEKDGAQAGHFMDGRHGTVLFDEELVHVQCYGCNVGKSGNKVEYFRFMIDKLGGGQQAIDLIDEMRARGHQVKKYKIWELQELYDHYKEEVEKNENT